METINDASDIKANLIVAGLRAVEKAEQTRKGVTPADASSPRGKDQTPATAVTYSTNASGSEITLKEDADQGLGSQLDCRV